MLPAKAELIEMAQHAQAVRYDSTAGGAAGSRVGRSLLVWLVLCVGALQAQLPAPISPALLGGPYRAANQHILLTVSGTDPQPGFLRTVAAQKLAGDGCWTHMVGNISDDGRTLRLSTACVSSVGSVLGSPADHSLAIRWVCSPPPGQHPDCQWPEWRPAVSPGPPPPPPGPSPPGPPGSWPIACSTDSSGLGSCWPTCQVRCPATAKCCKTPYAADKQGVGCCDTSPNPNREPGCKAGPPRALATDRPNVVVIGDSVSMGYTPWVQKHLGERVLVQHAPWGDGSAICNTTTDPPCDPDPTGGYTGDGGAEETAYGLRCLEYFIRHPNGQPLAGSASAPLVIMFNWGLHDGPLGNSTRPGQQGNSSVYPSQLRQIATRLHDFCAGAGRCKLLCVHSAAFISLCATDRTVIRYKKLRSPEQVCADIGDDLQRPRQRQCGGAQRRGQSYHGHARHSYC